MILRMSDGGLWVIKYNKSYLRDRIHACWIGKNIGGTIGAPYEGTTKILDVDGFQTASGAPLPNDDLDLQLIWLEAMNQKGPKHINSKVLGEYWLSYVGPWWNEYGVCKSNMKEGILAPLSGNFHNDEWKNSNGAWIRTEIWACTFPGLPDEAIRMAFEDASVDHGYGEGTIAAIFIAAMESASFVVNDLRELIKIGLSKIPEKSRVAQSAQIVLDAYDLGQDWKTARNRVVEDSRDLGWFQAPANVAFVLIGLLYGKGDFKQSVLLAVDCGDDTDCTGATVGAIMGLLLGVEGIPKDWRDHVGDAIVTVCVVGGPIFLPKSCEELTDCVLNLIPEATRRDNRELREKGPVLEITEEDNDFSKVDVEGFYGHGFIDEVLKRATYSYCVEGVYASALIEFKRAPYLEPGESLEGRCTISIFQLPEQKHFHLTWRIPDGWSVSGKTNLFVNPACSKDKQNSFVDFIITAGEWVEPVNRLIIEATCEGRETELLIPITILS